MSPGWRAFRDEVIDAAKMSVVFCLFMFAVIFLGGLWLRHAEAKSDAKEREEYRQLVARQRELMLLKEQGRHKQVKVRTHTVTRGKFDIRIRAYYDDGPFSGHFDFSEEIPPLLLVPLPKPLRNDPRLRPRESIDDMVRRLSVPRDDESVELVYLPGSPQNHYLANELDSKLREVNEQLTSLEPHIQQMQNWWRDNLIGAGEVALLFGCAPLAWTLFCELTDMVLHPGVLRSKGEPYETAGYWNSLINLNRGVPGQEERLAACRLGRRIVRTSKPGVLAEELSNKERVGNSPILSTIVRPMWATAFMMHELRHSWNGLTEAQRTSLLTDVTKCLHQLESRSGSPKSPIPIADLADRFLRKAVAAQFPEDSLTKLRKLQDRFARTNQDRGSIDLFRLDEMLSRERKEALQVLSRRFDFESPAATK